MLFELIAYQNWQSLDRECIDSGKWKRVTSGCGAVDEILGNGLSTVGITEICGEAGSGKSQFCLQLSLAVQLPVHLGGLGRGKLKCYKSIGNF